MKSLLASFLLLGTLVAEPTPTAIKTFKKIDGHELKLHIFNPAGHQATDKTPAIIFFFGGGWNGGTPKQFYPQSEFLAKRGMVAMSAEYRVKSRHQATPMNCVQDGLSAIRWVREHAKELGIDPDMLAAGGGSAGGQVAAACGTTKGLDEPKEDKSISSKPNALVLFNPVFDNGPEPGGWGHARVKDYWEKFSPRHNIDKTSAPTIVFLGTADHLIPASTAESYRLAMEQSGVRCDLHLYEGSKHGFFNQGRKGSQYSETMEAADEFLVSLGYLSKK